VDGREAGLISTDLVIGDIPVGVNESLSAARWLRDMRFHMLSLLRLRFNSRLRRTLGIRPMSLFTIQVKTLKDVSDHCRLQNVGLWAESISWRIK
jgi:hypothetical protein